jgi:hypothetical protein
MAWRTLLALGLGAAVAAGCTAKVEVGPLSNDGGPDGSGNGGSNTGGGANTGGSSGSGGSATGGGGSGTGGAANTGGGTGDSGACTPTASTDPCARCALENCCADYNDCTNNDCAGTNATGSDGELFCMITCLTNGNTGVSPDAGQGPSGNLQECSDACKKGPAVLDQQTQAVITCLTAVGDGGAQVCGQACFEGNVQLP